MAADPRLAAWRLARAGKWDRFERVLRRSAAARSFMRMLPYQMYFDGYQRAEHIARVIDVQEAATCRDDERHREPRTAAVAPHSSCDTELFLTDEQEAEVDLAAVRLVNIHES